MAFGRGIDTAWAIETLTLQGGDLNRPLDLRGTLVPEAPRPIGRLLVQGKAGLFKNDALSSDGSADLELRTEGLEPLALLAAFGSFVGNQIPGCCQRAVEADPFVKIIITPFPLVSGCFDRHIRV